MYVVDAPFTVFGCPRPYHAKIKMTYWHVNIRVFPRQARADAPTREPEELRVVTRGGLYRPIFFSVSRAFVLGGASPAL